MSTIAPPPKPTNPVLVDSEGYIDQQIRRTRRSLKLLDLAAGTLTLLIGLLAFVLVGALIDHWIVPGGLSDGGRLALFGVMLAGVAWYGWRQFVPLLKPINPVYAAQTIERNTPTLKNSLLNLLLFRSHRNYLSARVYHALEQQTAVKLSSSGVDGSLDRSALLRLGYVLLGVIAVCAIYAVLSPKSLALSTLRVINPLSDIAAPSRVQILDVKPGKTSVARGERVEVSAEIHGLSADEPVRLRYSTADETTVDESIRMERPTAESRRFEAALPRGTDAGVEQDLSYWIEAGDARSRKFKLTVFTRPTLMVQKIHYAYPPYTGLPTKEANHVGDIRGVEGTKVTIGALASQKIKNAYVDFDADGTSDLPMKTDGDRAMVTFPLELRDDHRTPVHPKYALRFTAEDGRQNADPPVYSIEVTPDYAPEVSITQPEEPEQVARLGDVIPIGIEALDPDYGLKSVTIVGKVDDADAVPLLEMINEPQTGRTVATKLFTPGDADLKPGDVLEYWAVALDGRPEPNIGLSEHRRLKIIGPDKPQQGNQEQRPNQGAQQPNDGEQGGENGESGQGGAGGQGGESSEGGGEGEQSGAGGSSGKGKAGESGQESDQGQDGAGGSGGGNKSGDSKEESDQAGDNGGGSSGSEGEQSEGDAPQDGSQGSGGGASGQKQQPQDGQTPSEQGGASGEAGGQDSGEAGGAGGKVSPEGDEDATALQRIMEDWNKKNPQQDGSGKPGEQQPGGEQQAGGEQQPGEAGQPGESNGEQQGADGAQQEGAQDGQQQPGEQASERGNNLSRDAAGERSPNDSSPDNQQAGANSKQPEEGEAGEGEQMNGGEQQGQPPNGSPQSKDAAGQSQQGSGQQPQAEGAQPQGPGEQAGDKQQQGGATGENPSKREGASQAREAKPGDGEQEKQEGQQPSPDSAMNESGGESGAGHSTGEEQGAPGSDGANRQGTKKNQEDNRPGREDNEAPVGSPDNKESDSKGGLSGEQSGGGQQGGGQKAKAPGKGGAGEHEAADEGANRAQEQGEGETGTQAGDQQKANGKTGQSSGDQAGNGSKQGETGESEQQQPGEEQASEQGNNLSRDAAGERSPNNSSPNNQSQGNQQGKPGEQGSKGSQGQPAGEQQSPAGNEQGAEGGEKPAGSESQGDQPGGEASGRQPPSGSSPNDQPPGDQQNNQQPGDKPSNQNAAGSAPPMGGGTGSNAQSSSSAESGQLGADKANLEYARQQTNLVLEGLDQQLAKKQVDRELLKNLGWTEAELRQFIDRWKNLKERAAGEGEDADDAKQELDETLGSLGIRKDGPLRFQGKAKADDLRANDALRVKPPSEYADRVREYTKGISSQRKD